MEGQEAPQVTSNEIDEDGAEYDGGEPEVLEPQNGEVRKFYFDGGSEHGTIMEISAAFGGANKLRQAVNDLQNLLYVA